MGDSENRFGDNEKPLGNIVRRVKALMQNWGFGEGCSSVYAVLITSPEPLSVDEIGKKTNYAYSSTINYLNSLMRMGLVERIKSIKKNLYLANATFVELMNGERERVKGHLCKLSADLEGMKDLEYLREKVEHAMAYLRRVESVEDSDE